MAEQLGRIERPSLEAYRGKRKLLLVPVLALPPDDAEDGIAIVGKYWEQVQTQVTSLELRVGWVKHVYHETLPEGGDEGLKILEASGEQGSYALAQTRCQAGAVLEAAGGCGDADGDHGPAAVPDAAFCLLKSRGAAPAVDDGCSAT